MNIFFLHETAKLSAKYLVDKHIVKMPLESAQMLSTAHRLLDGQMVVGGNNKKQWLLPGETEDNLTPIYKVAHAKHPSTLWTMQNEANYIWHFELFRHMLNEYTRRYGKQHKSAKLIPYLMTAPKNIPRGNLTPPPLAMPDHYKIEGDHIASYRRYYAGEKWRFAKWKNPESNRVPEWFFDNMKLVWNDERFSDRVLTIQKISKKKTLPLDEEVFNTAIALSKC